MSMGIQNDAARRAAEELARKIAEEAAKRAAEEAARAAARSAAMQAKVSLPKDTFTPSPSGQGSKGSAATSNAGSTLRTEDRTDSQVNCLHASSKVDPALIRMNVADPPRTTAQATAEARALFVARSGGASNVGGTTVNYRHVNDTSKAAEAAAQVTANAQLEQAALANLPAADQTRYNNLKAALASNPEAQLSLQLMLLEGRLPGAQAADGSGNTLQQLEALSTQPMVSGLDGADQLLAQVVREIAIPESIFQGYRGTCAASSAIVSLAQANPAEYVRIIAGLASPAGEVTLADGHTVARREPGTERDDGYGRSVTHRLIGPAMMEVANGADYNYDQAEDPGLASWDAERLMEALFNRPFSQHWTITTGFGLGYSNANIAIDAFKAGKQPILVGTFFPNAWNGHMLVLNGVEEQNGTIYVNLTNPWGQTIRLSYEEFAGCVMSVVKPE